MSSNVKKICTLRIQYFQVNEMVPPLWMDFGPLQLSESSAGNITDFDRNDLTGNFTGTAIGRCVGTDMDTHPAGTEETGTGSILGWGIDNGIGTGTGIVKHFQDQGTSTDTGTSSSGSNIDRGTSTTNFTGLLPISDSESDLLHPILESESESSLTGLPFKPRTFDDNLVNHLHLPHLNHDEDHLHLHLPHLEHDDDQAFYFQEVGPLEEEKSVEEIFVSGQKSAVEFGIDLQRRWR